eukprot:12319011-Alexandrium_andersonii.AAC.1
MRAELNLDAAWVAHQLAAAADQSQTLAAFRRELTRAYKAQRTAARAEDDEDPPSFARFAAANGGMTGGAQVSAADLPLTLPELDAFAREYRAEGEK